MALSPNVQRRIAQDTIAASVTRSMELPDQGLLAAIEIHVAASLTTTSGAITIVDSTLGIIPLLINVQLVLDGVTIPLSVSGIQLDQWGHVDRPGSERLALSDTASGGAWDAVLRYETAQSPANTTGSIRMGDYASRRLEVTFGALSLVASGTGLAVSGNVDIYGDMYDERSGIAADTSVLHTLSAFTADITASGERGVNLPKGRALERMLIVPENNGVVGVWNLLDDIALELAPGETPFKKTTPVFRADQLRTMGGDDIPIQGLYVIDRRRAGNRDVIPLGDPRAAPSPRLVMTVSSTPTLTNARVHVIREELEAVGLPAAA